MEHLHRYFGGLQDILLQEEKSLYNPIDYIGLYIYIRPNILWTLRFIKQHKQPYSGFGTRFCVRDIQAGCFDTMEPMYARLVKTTGW